MSPFTNTWYGPNDNIAIYTETTIPTLPSHFVNKYFLDANIQAMFDKFDKQHEKNDKQDAKFDKQHEELLNLTSISLRL